MQLRRHTRAGLAWLRGSGAELRGRVVVFSPHLDDAVLSLGATIAHAVQCGADVTVLTVFAGDPTSDLPAGPWDTRTGFVTAGEAARVRRVEDEAACAVIGAQPHWLPFADQQYPRDEDDVIVDAGLAAVADADCALLPGFPLLHDDHLRVHRLFAVTLQTSRVGIYVEQPYAALWTSGPEDGAVGWAPAAGGAAAQLAKARAARAYRSQLSHFGVRRPVNRIQRYEAIRGGEALAWLETPVSPGR